MAHPAAFDIDISGCTRTERQTFVYEYSWEQVVASYLMRFPKHDLLPVLLNSEVLSDEVVDSDTKTRVIIRRCFIDVEAPGWLKKATGVESLSFIQTTHIDPRNRFIRIMNFNEQFKDRAVFGDDCCFKADAENPNKSHFEQYGFFSLPKQLPFCKQIEKIMCKNYEKHSVEGRIIDVALIKECISSGMWASLSALGPDMLLKMPCEQVATSSNKAAKARSITPPRKLVQTVSTKSEKSVIKESPIVTRLATAGTARLDRNVDAPTQQISPESYTVLVGGLLLAPCLQAFLFNTVLSQTLSSFVMALMLICFLGYHIIKYGYFWLVLLRSLHPALFAKPEVPEIVATIPKQREESKSTPSTPLSAPFSKKTSFSANDPFSVISDDQGSDSDSDNEAQAADVRQEEEELEDDDEIDEDELKEDGMETDDDFDDSLFLQSPTGDEADEFSTITKLRELKVRCPAFIDKSIVSSGLVHFVVEVTLPNGARRSVERIYSDFVRLRKYFLKNIPQCKVQLQPSFLPKKKSNRLALGNSLDQRRRTFENYLSGLLLDEAVSKLGFRVLLEFLKRRGPLFPPSSFRKNLSVPKKRFFGSSLSGSNSQSVEQLSSPTGIKSVNFLKVRWKTCMKEVRVTFDKSSGTIKMFCRLPAQKEAHCVLSVDDLEKLSIMSAEEKAVSDQDYFESMNAPFYGDRYCFLKMVTTYGDPYYLCSSKEVVVEWIAEIEAYRATSLKKSSPSKSGLSVSKKRRRTIDNIQASDTKMVLNRRRLLFVAELSKKHPNDIASDLLNSILAIFQEYTDFKCTMPSKTLKKYLKFLEQTCELQIIDLQKLTTHSESLSFFLNLYHTLVVHAHMELGLEYSHPNAKRIKLVFRVVCYELNNQLFSLQDLEHSILRAKMSRPITLRNSFISQILTPRFNKNDERNRWALTKPDLRINFVLNSGTKSSIYNVWVFSSNPDLLNIQLDHASTHYLNEQITVDHARSIVYLPRICQHYSNDLGGSKSIIMKTLVKYMSVQMEREIKIMLRTEKSKMKVKYNNVDWAWRGVFFKGHDTLCDDMEGCQLKPVSAAFTTHSLPSTPNNIIMEQSPVVKNE